MSEVAHPDNLVGAYLEAFQMGILSERQAQVLLMTAEDFTVNEIAASLNLSYHTVLAHIEQGKSKVGAGSKPHYVARAFTLGILRPKSDGSASIGLLAIIFLLSLAMFIAAMGEGNFPRRNNVRTPRTSVSVRPLRRSRNQFALVPFQTLDAELSPDNETDFIDEGSWISFDVPNDVRLVA